MTAKLNRYEGMFLFPQTAVSNLTASVDHIKAILDRSDAKIISLSKWDERRLAYDIKGNKRGVYFLVYFEAAGENMQKIERDFNLSEELLRWIIVRADHLTLEQMQAADGQTQIADEAALRAEDEPESRATGTSTATSVSAATATATAEAPAPAADAAPDAEAEEKPEKAGE